MEHVTKRIDGASAVVDNLMVSAKAKETRGKLICTNDFAHVFWCFTACNNTYIKPFYIYTNEFIWHARVSLKTSCVCERFWAWPGRERLEALQERLNKACSEYHTANDINERARSLTSKMKKSFGAEDDFQICGNDLADRLEIDPGDSFTRERIIPQICEEAAKELDNFDEEYMSKSLPGDLLLQHAYFRFKVETDVMKSRKEIYDKVKTQFQNLQEKTSKRKLDKLEIAERVVKREEALQANPSLRERKLARRNQLNRRRHNVKRVKAERDKIEKGLPEAWISCHVLKHLDVSTKLLSTDGSLQPMAIIYIVSFFAMVQKTLLCVPCHVLNSSSGCFLALAIDWQRWSKPDALWAFMTRCKSWSLPTRWSKSTDWFPEGKSEASSQVD